MTFDICDVSSITHTACITIHMSVEIIERWKERSIVYRSLWATPDTVAVTVVEATVVEATVVAVVLVRISARPSM